MELNSETFARRSHAVLVSSIMHALVRLVSMLMKDYASLASIDVDLAKRSRVV